MKTEHTACLRIINISEQITDVDFAVDDVEIAVEDADQAEFADLLGHAVRSVRR